MRPPFALRVAALAAALALVGCDQVQRIAAPGGTPPVVTAAGARLDPVFERAGAEFGVPSALLKAIAYAETRFEMVRGEEEFPGVAAAYGVMALRGARLERGASLAGVAVDAARTDAESNVRAAAALLRAYADESGLANRADAGAWAVAVARFSGIAGAEEQAAYVHDEVYAALNAGVVAHGADGAVVASIVAAAVRPLFAAPARPAGAPDYPARGTVWRPSPNYNARPSGDAGRVTMVVIHDCEGSYRSCVGTLVEPSRQASAHYVVNERGSEIAQLVRERDRAWHTAATYECARANAVQCARTGTSTNDFTIGIEHAGFASQRVWPAAQLDASARLACDVSTAHGIPRDRQHFVGHGQLQPYNRSDPGPNWPWGDYLGRINAACGGGEVIVDSNNENNDRARGYLELSESWTVSSNVAGYYGTGYYHAPAKAVSDGATFWVHLSAPATKTVDAWWAAASDRTTAAPFVVYDAAGTRVGAATANQQTNGGRWNTLGRFALTAGWNRVVLSRWTDAGGVVIADAVRVR